MDGFLVACYSYFLTAGIRRLLTKWEEYIFKTKKKKVILQEIYYIQGSSKHCFECQIVEAFFHVIRKRSNAFMEMTLVGLSKSVLTWWNVTTLYVEFSFVILFEEPFFGVKNIFWR